MITDVNVEKLAELVKERAELKAKLAQVEAECTVLRAKEKNDVAEISRAAAEMEDYRRELVAHREKAQGNYWAWQGDGEDHLESLVDACPVLIHVSALREIIKQRDIFQADCAAMRKLAEKLVKAIETWEPSTRDSRTVIAAKETLSSTGSGVALLDELAQLKTDLDKKERQREAEVFERLAVVKELAESRATATRRLELLSKCELVETKSFDKTWMRCVHCNGVDGDHKPGCQWVAEILEGK